MICCDRFLRQCAASNSDLFKGWCVIEVSERSGINKALINIKRSRRQAVTALNIIVIANYPFEKHYILASLVKGRWIDGKAQALTLLHLLAICPPFLHCKLFCRQDGGIAPHCTKYCYLHNHCKRTTPPSLCTKLARPRKMVRFCCSVNPSQLWWGL